MYWAPIEFRDITLTSPDENSYFLSHFLSLGSLCSSPPSRLRRNVWIPIRAEFRHFPIRLLDPQHHNQEMVSEPSTMRYTREIPENSQGDQVREDESTNLTNQLDADKELECAIDQLETDEPHSSMNSSSSPRIRLLYDDETTRSRFCANAQRLLVAALEDPSTNSKSAQIARKALRYRNVMNRLEEVDPFDPQFDVSAFLGVEWQRKGQEVNEH